MPINGRPYLYESQVGDGFNFGSFMALLGFVGVILVYGRMAWPMISNLGRLFGGSPKPVVQVPTKTVVNELQPIRGLDAPDVQQVLLPSPVAQVQKTLTVDLTPTQTVLPTAKPSPTWTPGPGQVTWLPTYTPGPKPVNTPVPAPAQIKIVPTKTHLPFDLACGISGADAWAKYLPETDEYICIPPTPTDVN